MVIIRPRKRTEILYMEIRGKQYKKTGRIGGICASKLQSYVMQPLRSAFEKGCVKTIINAFAHSVIDQIINLH